MKIKSSLATVFLTTVILFVSLIGTQGVSAQTTPATWCHTFNTNLTYGNNGSEVTALQTALAKEGFYNGDINGVYDLDVYNAVKSFQKEYNITSTGYTRSYTRAKLNELYKCKGDQPSAHAIPIQPSLAVSLSAGTNLSKTVTNGKTNISLARFNFVATNGIVSVTDISFAITPSAGADLIKNVKLVNKSVNIGTINSFNPGTDMATGVIHFSSPFVVQPNNTATLILSADTADSGAGSIKAGITNVATSAPVTVTDKSGIAFTNVFGSEATIKPKIPKLSSNPATNPIPSQFITIYSVNNGNDMTLAGQYPVGWTYKDILFPVGRHVDVSIQNNDTGYVKYLGEGSLTKGVYNFYVPKDAINFYAGGKYKIKIKLQNTDIEAYSQDFTFVKSPLDDSVKLISPNGGEVWKTGKNYVIKYSLKTPEVGKPVYIYLEKFNTEGAVDTSVLLGGTLDRENYIYNFTSSFAGDKLKIKIADYSANAVDNSDDYFSIVEPTANQPSDTVPTCAPNWKCGWGACTNGYQSQTAIDSNNCGLPLSSANIACTALARQCTTQPTVSTTPTCVPNWQCGGWGSCVNGSQTIACTDLNNCGVANNAPGLVRQCTTQTSCTDTDGGKDFYTKGTVTYSSANGNSGSRTDACDSSTTLEEYSCDSTGVYVYKYNNFVCPNGCSNGACKKTTSLAPDNNNSNQDLLNSIAASLANIAEQIKALLPGQ